jgi:ketosteroid isomerase-like protein
MSDAIKAANADFYRAFEALSIEGMEAIWSHQDDVRCVHPGWEALCGWEAVQKSWAGIFESARQAGTYMEFNVSDVQVWSGKDLAGIFCHENILSFREGEQVRSIVLATNVFRREGDRWLIIQHHGSPVLTKPTSD